MLETVERTQNALIEVNRKTILMKTRKSTIQVTYWFSTHIINQSPFQGGIKMGFQGLFQ